jgi:2-hydroxy-6-oxonona-2,4-dienedioate hydrolase
MQVERRQAVREDTYREAERRMWASVGVAPSERRSHLAGIGVDIRIQEMGEGPPVLFVHGASNSGTSWAGLVSRLEGFRCLLLDRPGCGLSQPLSSPFANVADLERFSDSLVVDVLDALDLEVADIVATSYGGYSALRAAAVHPERIRRVVIFGWPMGAANPALPWFMRLAGVPRLARFMVAMPVNDRVVRSMFKRIGLRDALAGGRVSDELINAYTSLLRDTDTMRNEIEIGRWNMTWKGLNEDLVLRDDVLSKIEAPVYLLWGENDPFGPPESARAFAQRIPTATLELMPGAGHAVWIDDPDHAAEVVTEFLAASS